MVPYVSRAAAVWRLMVDVQGEHGQRRHHRPIYQESTEGWGERRC